MPFVLSLIIRKYKKNLYYSRHPKNPAKNGIVNNAGLTPLTLACKLGRSEVFREMLELSCREFWRYSNITCSAYPLNALDTLMPDGSTSELMILKINNNIITCAPSLLECENMCNQIISPPPSTS